MLPILVAAVPLLVVAASRVLFPYDLGPYEGGTWEPARLLMAGHNPYLFSRTIEPPFVMAPYGPVFYAAIGVGVRLFGEQFWCGRMIATVSLAVSALLVALMATRLEGRAAGRLAALVFLVQLPVHAWMAVQRADALALTAGLGALYLAIRPIPRLLAGTVCSALLAAACLLLRQTAIAPVLAVVACLALVRPRTQAVVFLVVLALALLIPTAVLEATSDGGYLWQQYRLAAAVPLSTEQVERMIGMFVRHPGSWLVAALLVRVSLGWLASGRSVTQSARVVPGAVICAALILSTVVALVTSARLGSNVNYWLEPCALVALTIALARPTVMPRREPLVARSTVWALAIVCAFQAVWLLRAEWDRWSTRDRSQEIVAALRLLEPSASPVITVYPELAVYAGRTYLFTDGIQYDPRSPVHHALFLRVLREGSAAALVLPFDRSPSGYTRVELRSPPSSTAPAYLFVRR